VLGDDRFVMRDTEYGEQHAETGRSTSLLARLEVMRNNHRASIVQVFTSKRQLIRGKRW
jgi:hypothetical protein